MVALSMSVNVEFGFCCVSLHACAPSPPCSFIRAAVCFSSFPSPGEIFSRPGRNSNQLGITRPLDHGVAAAAAALQLQNRKTNAGQGPLFSLLVSRASSSSNEAWRLNEPRLEVEEAGGFFSFPRHRFLR